jgi:hypothetical protein
MALELKLEDSFTYKKGKREGKREGEKKKADHVAGSFYYMLKK